MATADTPSSAPNAPNAFRFLSGASSLVLLQVLTRVATFVLNQALVRFSTPQVFGTASIQFELLLSSILFISREGVRLALLRSTDKKDETTPETNEITSSPKIDSTPSKLHKRKGGKADTSPQADQLSTHKASADVLSSNIATLPVLFGLCLSLVLPMAYIWTASPESSAQPHFRLSILIYTASAMLQLAAEPMYILAQQELNFTARVRSEAAGVVSRAAITVGILVVAERLHPAGEKTPGGGNEWGLLAFSLGQLSYGFFVFVIYLWTYMKRSSEWRWWPKSITMIDKGHAKRMLFDPVLLRLAFSMTLQSFIKHLLTEGDKFAVSRISKLADQGGYAVASNYGSLVARLLFQPVEEITRVFFSKTLAVCTIEEDQDNTKKAKPVAVQSEKASDKEPEIKNPLTSEQQMALRQSSATLHSLLRVQMHVLLILVVFLPPYLPTLLAHFLPKKYLATSAPSILQAYAYYLPMMSINGIVEAFAFSVMSANDVKRQARWLFVTSISFGLFVWLFCEKLGQGDAGLVAANTLSLGMRAGWALWFADQWFNRIWNRGVKPSKTEGDKNAKGVVPTDSAIAQAPKGISMGEILPPWTVLLVFMISREVIRQSQDRHDLHSNLFLQDAKNWDSLKKQVMHVAVGGVCGLICLLEAFRSQRSQILRLFSAMRRK